MVSELIHQRTAYGWSPDQNYAGPSKNAPRVGSGPATPEVEYEGGHQAIIASDSYLTLIQMQLVRVTNCI